MAERATNITDRNNIWEQKTLFLILVKLPATGLQRY